jgi:pimeloyl-ACP methyl ester carboxylesterase
LPARWGTPACAWGVCKTCRRKANHLSQERTIISVTANQIWLFVALAGMPLLAGCLVTSSPTLDPMRTAGPMPPATVFVENGAGNYQLTTRALRHLARKDGEPLEFITFDWSHGKHRFLADEMHHAHARAQGETLAETVIAYHAKHPDRPIYLLGHSAGTSVTMAALENLPEGIVERAILLSPSLSADYDVRPALRSVKQGLHVFYSRYDYIYLGLATGLVGSPDRYWTAAAGRTGFRVPADADPEQFRKLVQRSWQSSDRAFGNNGGHFGNTQPDFMRAQILPLFNSAPNAVIPTNHGSH